MASVTVLECLNDNSVTPVEKGGSFADYCLSTVTIGMHRLAKIWRGEAEQYQMRYQAVVFDWAGTMIDFGSFAPVKAFIVAFGEFGIEVSEEQAREPMGMAKRDHIKAILELPNIISKFESIYGHIPGNEDIDRIYNVFVPMNENIVTQFANLVPGAAEAVTVLRERGLKVGSTTGYTRSIMEQILPIAANQGYAPDNLVCSDEVAVGRPAPHAMKRCFSDLGILEPASVIKVDDTEPGIGEGKSAGCLTVGVTLSGNFAGKSPQEIAQLDEDEVNKIRLRAGKMLRDAGADYVIDSVAKLPALIDQLEA